VTHKPKLVAVLPQGIDINIVASENAEWL